MAELINECEWKRDVIGICERNGSPRRTYLDKAFSGKRGTRLRTFGDYAKWHPHIHSIVADGLFRRSGMFYVMPKINISPVAELFRANVLSMLKEEGQIDDAFISMSEGLSWNDSVEKQILYLHSGQDA